MTLMCIPAGCDIGEEVHHDVDQVLFVKSGRGVACLDSRECSVCEGYAVFVPCGVRHNLINTSRNCPLKLVSIYAPPEHPRGTVHKTKCDDND
jgi:mannose-6-phosphate isomerase-like protein (cupin superfamily)